MAESEELKAIKKLSFAFQYLYQQVMGSLESLQKQVDNQNQKVDKMQSFLDHVLANPKLQADFEWSKNEKVFFFFFF